MVELPNPSEKYARAKNHSFHLLALLFLWRCHREIRCDAAASSAALPPHSIVPCSGKKECPCLHWGKCCIVPYIIILLNYHGVRIKVQMNGLVLGVSQLLHQLSSIFTLSSSSSPWPLISELFPYRTRVKVMVGSPLRHWRRPIPSQHLPPPDPCQTNLLN